MGVLPGLKMLCLVCLIYTSVGMLTKKQMFVLYRITRHCWRIFITGILPSFSTMVACRKIRTLATVYCEFALLITRVMQSKRKKKWEKIDTLLIVQQNASW